MHFDSWVMDVLAGNQMKIESVEGGKQERAKRGKPKKKEKTEFDEITLLMEELSITEGKKGKRGRQKMLMVNFQDSVFSGYQSEECKQTTLCSAFVATKSVQIGLSKQTNRRID